LVIKEKFGRYLIVAPFFFIKKMTDKNNEELRPSKMRGVAFPKAKYGVIVAIIIIVIVNLIYYKEFFLSLIR
tara:strand:+ start:149 stop:364 length:216 start_codon:yes stop_codon:yes gene_type:complete